MSWSIVLFDLDGTLTNPQLGITSAVAYSLSQFGIVEAPENLTKFIGPPLLESFAEFYGFSREKSLEAITQFRVYFDDHGWIENEPYPNISAMLSALKEAGKQLIVASSKPEIFVVRIMEHFGLSQYFDVMCGSPNDEAKGTTKADVIRDALSRAHIDETDSVVMVGDRKHDVNGAHECNLPCIGVLYGFGDLEEMRKCGADYVCNTTQDLLALLLK